MRVNPVKSFKIVKIFSVALAVLFSVGFNLLEAHRFEFMLYDLRFRLNPISFKSPHIELVGVSFNTIKLLGRKPNVSDFNRVLKNILMEKPIALFLTLNPQNLEGSEEEKRMFVDLLKKFDSYYIYSEYLPNKGEENILKLKNAFSGLEFSPSMLSFDYQHFAEDRVARRAVLTSLDQTFAQVKIARLIDNTIEINNYRGVFYFSTPRFDDPNSRQIFVNYQRTGTYKYIPFESILNNDNTNLSGKIVIIGSEASHESSDYVKTVYDRNSFAMSLAEANANVIATLIHDKGIIKTGFWVNFPFTLVFAVIVALGVFALTPIQGIFLALGALIAICFISWFLFVVFGVAIGTIYPILTVFSIYYLFVPYRLIQETKKNLEAQKELQLARVTAKSAKVDLGFRIATQVAHDLKSPLMALMTVKSVGQETVKPELLDLLGRSIDKIDQITKELLKKFGRGSFEFQNKDVSQNLTTIIKNVIKSQSQIYPNSRFEFVGTTEDILIDIQGAEIERALNNLVINAVEASHSKAQVQILIEKTQESVLVSVIDKGPGIPPHIQDQIFKPGFTFGKKTGTGIGLAQVQDAVSNNGGTIRLVSSRSGETVFQMTFPLKKQGNLKLLISDNALVIEDSVDTQAIWEDIFTNQGINFKIIKNYRDFESEYTSTNGKFFGDKEFTVITDLVFEGEDLGGFDVLEKFKSAKNNLFKNAYVCTSLSGNQEIVKIAKNYDCEVIGKQDILGLEIVKS